jgi:beta-glucosidase
MIHLLWLIPLVLVALYVALRVYNRGYRRIDVSPAAYPWPRGIDDRELDGIVDDLLGRMSLSDKVHQLSGDGGDMLLVRLGAHVYLLRQFPHMYAGHDPDHGIPPISFGDGPRGLVVGEASAFPVAIGRGASWDRELERRVGDAIGVEARALGVNYFGGLCINLLRHPGWGRAQETYGEDPWHVGQLGVALLTAVQRHNVMVCAKHFALNSIENSRFFVDVQLDDRTFHEVYLPHFRRCVDAGVASVMSAYNRVRGQWCGHSPLLLDEILRRRWGFEGFVSCDWVWGMHGTVEPAVAGMDVEMPRTRYYGRRLLRAVRAGRLDPAVIERNARRVVRTKLRFVTREDPEEYPAERVECDAHRELARESAEASMVLLRNEGPLLPLDPGGLRRLAVIGALATERNLGDRGSSMVSPKRVVCFLDGIRERLGGEVEVVFDEGRDAAAVREAAEGADAVVVVAGRRWYEEGENLASRRKPGKPAKVARGGDRTDLALRSDEVAMILAAVAANPRAAVVLVGGSAITMEAWRESVPAILMAWYPGMEGGNALARILFGDVCPGGKLPFSIPSDAAQLPPFDPWTERADYGYLHGYTLIDERGVEPAFRFGFGLSYTTFTLGAPELARPTIPADGTLEIAVPVTNSGDRAGAEVVQVYISFPDVGVDRPVKLLRAFEKVQLAPGETRAVSLTIEAADLARYEPETERWIVDPGEYQALAGASSAPGALVAAPFRVT